MKRPLYYLLCAIACTSMVSATMPMTAIAEAIQPQATANQQTQADAATSDAGKAENGANTNTPAENTATSNGTAAPANTSQPAPADANTAGAAATPGGIATPNTTATPDNIPTAPTPSLRTSATPTPEAITTAAATAYAHSVTATQNGVTFTVSWNDAPAGAATTFHVTQAGGSSQAKARMDVPTYWDGGSQESVCDPSSQAWASYHNLGTAGHDFTFDFTASGAYRIYFYFMDNDRNDPQNDKGIYYLRTMAEVTVNDAARPSVTQIVNNAVTQCRQETNGSEYDMALWLHDWTLDQLEYDHSLNWCSAESGLTRHQGTCESYQRIYSKLLNAAGIANGRITGNGHTWNAVKIDGKWCQMDLTWDDTSDNWYGDLDQRHLYFGLTDELMAIAHSDHTANYQKEDYAYRSTDLSNNFFVRNGKADEWAEKYADRIQQHLDAKEEGFSIDADNQTFPPSISGIQNGIVAYAMNQREWKAGDAKVEINATSNVENKSNSKWSAKYDLKAEYKANVLKKTVEDGEYLLAPSLGPSLAVSASASGCSLSPSASPIRFAFDGATGCYRLTSGGMALTASGSAAVLAEPDGSASQLWRVEACEGGWSVASRASGLALDVYCRSAVEGNLVWLYESNGTAAQAWELSAPPARAVEDGEYLLAPSLGPSLAVSASASGCSLSPSASPIRFAFDGATGCYRLTSGGMALTASGSAAVLAEPDGSASQLWRIEACEGGWSVASRASGLALDVYCRSAVEGNLVWLYESNGTAAQAWELSAPPARAVEDGEYLLAPSLGPSLAVSASASGCSLSPSASPIRFAFDGATGCYRLTSGGMALTASGSAAVLAEPDGSASQLWRVEACEGGWSVASRASGLALDVYCRSAVEGNLVWLYESNGTAAQAWELSAPPARAVEDGEYLLAPSLGPSLAVSASASGCSLSPSASPIRFAFDGATGCYRLTSGGMALTASGSAAVLAEPDGSASQLWRVEACEGGWSVASRASGLALDVYCRSAVEGNLVWLYESNGTAAQAWELSAPPARAVEDGEYLLAPSLGPSLAVSASASGCSLSPSASPIRFAFDGATGCYRLTSGGMALTASGSAAVLAEPDGSASQLWRVEACEGGWSVASRASGLALDVYCRSAVEGNLVWLYESNGTAAQAWELSAPQ